jgi:hypothetical protein
MNEAYKLLKFYLYKESAKKKIEYKINKKNSKIIVKII